MPSVLRREDTYYIYAKLSSLFFLCKARMKNIPGKGIMTKFVLSLSADSADITENNYEADHKAADSGIARRRHLRAGHHGRYGGRRPRRRTRQGPSHHARGGDTAQSRAPRGGARVHGRRHGRRGRHHHLHAAPLQGEGPFLLHGHVLPPLPRGGEAPARRRPLCGLPRLHAHALLPLGPQRHDARHPAAVQCRPRQRLCRDAALRHHAP